MRLQFRDFYQQHVCVHNQTGSGNIRIKVNTMPSLNDVKTTPEECELETEIALDYRGAKLLHEALNHMLEDMEE